MAIFHFESDPLNVGSFLLTSDEVADQGVDFGDLLHVDPVAGRTDPVLVRCGLLLIAREVVVVVRF